LEPAIPQSPPITKYYYISFGRFNPEQLIFTPSGVKHSTVGLKRLFPNFGLVKNKFSIFIMILLPASSIKTNVMYF